MKILIISIETWRDDTNGGNVLSNLFENFDADFAQIYCSSGLPENKICRNYYQMTDAMALQNILKKKKMGRIVTMKEYIDPLTTDMNIRKIKNKGNFEILRIMRQIVWGLSDYKNKELIQFILEFNPDVIFAPCYGATYMLSLTRFVAEITKKPIISYISDDFYSLRQFKISPIYWFNKFVVRSQVRKTWKYYSLIYTMTDSQKNLMSKLGKPIKILRKSGNFENYNYQKEIVSPIKIIYAGGIYLNRWKTLVYIAKAIKEINKENKKFILDIYTNNTIDKKIYKILNDNENCFFHKAIPFDQLKIEYQKSDIALHVESFDIKNRLNVRMSFSTKIIDCLDSGCAVMAVSDKKQGGFVYLKNEDAAICIDTPKKIKSTLETILDKPSIINVYRKKALECGKRNHRKENNDKELKQDFERIADKNGYFTD